MARPAYAAQYVAGVRYFNQREFFESHEILEDIWNECELESRKFYQGLIQSAVALHHFCNGNVRGARKLYYSSRNYLEPYRPHYLGLDLDRFLEDMTACFEPLLGDADDVPDVEVDVERIPTIVLDPPIEENDAGGDTAESGRNE